MNTLQLLAFLVYAGAVFVVGAVVRKALCPDSRLSGQKKGKGEKSPAELAEGFAPKIADEDFNASTALAETFLLGSVFFVGAMVALACLGLYRGEILWGMVVVIYSFLLCPSTRQELLRMVSQRAKLDVPFFLLLGMLGVLVTRNYFPMITGDSHQIYLYAQKLWLAKGTAFVGSAAENIGTFTPHFNAVPYALGIALFGQETLFAQLIDLSWRVVVVFLVFGYTSWRLNRWWGIVAVSLVVFDEHFFYSGMNLCAILNGAVLAFLFAGLYNLWESRANPSSYRLCLGLIFIAQLVANKYQMIYPFATSVIVGLFIQQGLKGKVADFFRHRSRVIVFVLAMLCVALWFIRNYFLTGCPLFPAGADRLGVFNWTPETVHVFGKVVRPQAGMFLKYLSYLYIWHGVLASKIIFLFLTAFPFVLFLAARRKRVNDERLMELCYWLGTVFLVMIGICFLAFTDPRAYRFPLAVMAYSAVLSIVFVLESSLGWRRKWIFGWVGVVVCLMALPVTYKHKKELPSCAKPSVCENFAVMADRLHMKDLIPRYYPSSVIENRDWEKNADKTPKAAWDLGVGGSIPRSAFLSPIRPQVGLWWTTAVRFESYTDKEAIVRDLQKQNLEWVMRVEHDKLRFLTLAEYAEEAVTYDRYPKIRPFNYGFPAELAETHY